LRLLEAQFGVGQLEFNGGNAPREFGDFVLQAANFLVRILQVQQIFDLWKHPLRTQA